MNRDKRGDLFLQGAMTLLITIGFIFVGSLTIAVFVWGFSVIGPSVLALAVLLIFIIAAAWTVAGWLLKQSF